MRETDGLGWRVFFGFLAMLLIGYVAFAITTGLLLPWWTQVQRTVVIESNSFNQSIETTMLREIQAYHALSVDKERADEDTAQLIGLQQMAIYDTVCSQYYQQSEANRKAHVTLFLAENGSCLSMGEIQEG